jgi:hypothetical protein
MCTLFFVAKCLTSFRYAYICVLCVCLHVQTHVSKAHTLFDGMHQPPAHQVRMHFLIQTYTYMHTHIHAYVFTRSNSYTEIKIHIHIHKNIHTCMHIHACEVNFTFVSAVCISHQHIRYYTSAAEGHHVGNCGNLGIHLPWLLEHGSVCLYVCEFVL